MVEHIQEKEKFDESIKNGITLVDFFANWCSPCRMLSLVIEEYIDNHPEISVIKVDVDQAHELAFEYNVTSIPLIILFKNGVELDRRLGYMPLDEFEEFIENATK